MDARSQSAGGEAEQPAAGTDVEKAAAAQIIGLEHDAQRAFGLRDAVVVESTEESIPICAEWESLAASQFHRVGFLYVPSLRGICPHRRVLQMDIGLLSCSLHGERRRDEWHARFPRHSALSV